MGVSIAGISIPSTIVQVVGILQGGIEGTSCRVGLSSDPPQLSCRSGSKGLPKPLKPDKALSLAGDVGFLAAASRGPSER